MMHKRYSSATQWAGPQGTPAAPAAISGGAGLAKDILACGGTELRLESIPARQVNWIYLTFTTIRRPHDRPHRPAVAGRGAQGQRCPQKARSPSLAKPAERVAELGRLYAPP